MSITLTFPDGSDHEFESGVTGFEVAETIGPRLAKAAVAVGVDGHQLDLNRGIELDGSFEVYTAASEEGRSVIRHSAAHIMAQAVLDLYEGATFAIGPAIEDGFYYDFDIGRPFHPDDLEQIESRMAEIIAEDQPFEREAMSRSEALELFHSQPYKSEIIEAVDPSEVDSNDEVTVYRNLGFVDLCRGPHLPSTGMLNAVKLLRSSGAYWRGDETRDQLQRIYGTAWESKPALDGYLERLEEAERRDHRKLGPELDLISFPPVLGSGLLIWHPKGGMVRKLIEDHSRKLHEEYGFDFVFSPHIARSELWHTSGHLDYYAENMYPGMAVDENEEYRVKPMNCPFHVMVFGSRVRSYRELPLRLSELGSVYRYERSGVLSGALRVRGMTQDDSHAFCRRDQLAAELAMHLDFVVRWLSDFGFSDFEADLSTRPENPVGDEGLWDLAETTLQSTLDASDIPYKVAEGEGAFYGPKIDIHLKDAIGRRWQMSTIQLDFMLPDRFDISYISDQGEHETPVMIHCAKAGAIERFFAILLEHYAGAFPMWLAPLHATVVPVADRHIDYAGEVRGRLESAGLRAEVDNTSQTLGEKIRRGLTQKHPVLLIVGDDDVGSGTVGLRRYGEDSDQRGLDLDQLVPHLVAESQPPQRPISK